MPKFPYRVFTSLRRSGAGVVLGLADKIRR